VVGCPKHESASGFRIRLALASVAPVPLMVHEVETILSKKIDAKAVAEAAQRPCRPAIPLTTSVGVPAIGD